MNVLTAVGSASNPTVQELRIADYFVSPGTAGDGGFITYPFKQAVRDAHIDLSAGPGASEVALTNPIRETISAGSARLVAESNQPAELVLTIDPAEERWQRLKRRYFPPEWRQERIEAALKALEEAVVYYDLDADTMRWIVEEADEEDF